MNEQNSIKGFPNHSNIFDMSIIKNSPIVKRHNHKITVYRLHKSFIQANILCLLTKLHISFVNTLLQLLTFFVLLIAINFTKFWINFNHSVLSIMVIHSVVLFFESKAFCIIESALIMGFLIFLMFFLDSAITCIKKRGQNKKAVCLLCFLMLITSMIVIEMYKIISLRIILQLPFLVIYTISLKLVTNASEYKYDLSDSHFFEYLIFPYFVALVTIALHVNLAYADWIENNHKFINFMLFRDSI